MGPGGPRGSLDLAVRFGLGGCSCGAAAAAGDPCSAGGEELAAAVAAFRLGALKILREKNGCGR